MLFRLQDCCLWFEIFNTEPQIIYTKSEFRHENSNTVEIIMSYKDILVIILHSIAVI